MNPNDLPAREPESGLLHVLVDTPGGSRNKYKLDPQTNLYLVSRVLPLGMAFPYDFGSIPGTRAPDGDPLDVLVLGGTPTFPGCLLTVRLIGFLRAQQREGRRRIRNDRLLGSIVTPVNPPAVTSIDRLPAGELADIEQFFIAYNRAQGREFRITGRANARAAEKVLREAERRFAKSRGHST
jgi:inorganic pyrophosphatase